MLNSKYILIILLTVNQQLENNKPHEGAELYGLKT